MSTGPKRQNFPTGVQLLADDLNDAQRYASRALLRVLRRLLQNHLGAVQSGVLDGWALTKAASGALALDVSAGLGFLDDATGVSDTALDSTYRWVETLAPTTDVALEAADSTDPRIDVIYVQHGYGTVDTDARNIKDPVTGVVTVDPSAPVTKGPITTIGVVTGTPASSPEAPAAPANTIVLGRVTVPAGATVANDLTFLSQSGRTVLPTMQRPGTLNAVEVAGTVNITGNGGLQIAGSAAISPSRNATLATVTTTGAAIIGTTVTSGEGITAVSGDVRAFDGALRGKTIAVGTTEAEFTVDADGNAASDATIDAHGDISSDSDVLAGGKVQADGQTAVVDGGATEVVVFSGQFAISTPQAVVGEVTGWSGYNPATARATASIVSAADPDMMVYVTGVGAGTIDLDLRRAGGGSQSAGTCTVHVIMFAEKA